MEHNDEHIRGIARLAFSGAELPDSLIPADALYFLLVRAMAQYGKATGYSPEQWDTEHKKILEIIRRYEWDERFYAAHAEKMLKISNAITEYRKATTAEEALAAADRLVAAEDRIPFKRDYKDLEKKTEGKSEC